MKALPLYTLSSSSTWLWFLYVLSLCSHCFCNQNSSNPVACIATERLVLIQLKTNLIDRANRLSSWIGNDCCSWSGVVCNNVTGNVQELHLRGPDDGIHGHCQGPYDTDEELAEASKQMLGGTVTPSVTKLVQLTYFDLSCNDFGLIPIPTFFGSFQNLKYLNLSRSQFSGEIPHQLGNLSTLRVLDVQDTPLFTNLHSKSLKWLKDLKDLQRLDLSAVDLASALDWLQVITTLPSLLEIHVSLCGLTQFHSNLTEVSFTSLTVLDLSYNIFDDSLLPLWIFGLNKLVVLDLTNCFITGLNPGTHGGFRSMPYLRTLSVASNSFMNSSSLLNELSSLSNLRFLDVNSCNISAPILGNLRNLSFIVHLDLSNNLIVEEIPKSLGNLCNLITLDLQSNNFSGNASELLERFCECESPKLELLAFRGNDLTGQLPRKLGRLKSLGSIDLAYNQLTGTIPDSVGNLSLLKTLQMNINQLTGSIPVTIGDLTSLSFLDLSYNNLNGSLPETIARVGELVYLTIHHNSLTGLVTENHLTNLRSLKTLWIADNKLVFNLNINWIPPFQLEVLRIGSCSLGPDFPLWVQSQTNLAELDLGNTNISDTIPNWFWTTFSSVTFLNMSHNNIQGKLGNVSFLAPGALLDLSFNHLYGVLPGHFNGPDLGVLDLSYNKLSGSIEQFLCFGIQESRQLRVLNLANNKMSGVILDCWRNWELLTILNLENNHFFGTIPSSLGNISFLLSLRMRHNKLSGNLPLSLLNSKSLLIIELAENELVGRIPASIGRENTNLKLLSLRSNKLEGKIPDEICHLSSIQIMDLAHNDLSGNLPTCFTNFTVISGSETSSPFGNDTFYQNQLTVGVTLVTKRRVYTYGNILYLVTMLDLSKNKFSGLIPDALVSLLGLRYLNLSQNNLTGLIPNSFNKTGKLESLDLSENHLDGKFPSSLSALTALSFLNVSYNNLVGRIPTGPQLQTFDESSFIGNALCGDPLPTCLDNNEEYPRETDDQLDQSNGVDWILMSFRLMGLSVGFWIMIGSLIVSKRWRNVYYHSLEEAMIKLQIFILLRIFYCFGRHVTRHD